MITRNYLIKPPCYCKPSVLSVQRAQIVTLMGMMKEQPMFVPVTCNYSVAAFTCIYMYIHVYGSCLVGIEYSLISRVSPLHTIIA